MHYSYWRSECSQIYPGWICASRSEQAGAGKDRIIVLVLDNAGWREPAEFAVPVGPRLVDLPPCSPQPQPVATLWPRPDQPLANTRFATLDHLQETAAARAVQLQPFTVAGPAGFRWRPKPIVNKLTN